MFQEKTKGEDYDVSGKESRFLATIISRRSFPVSLLVGYPPLPVTEGRARVLNGSDAPLNYSTCWLRARVSHNLHSTSQVDKSLNS